MKDAALLVEFLHSFGMAHADHCITRDQCLQLVLSPPLCARWAQGYFDESAQGYQQEE